MVIVMVLRTDGLSMFQDNRDASRLTTKRSIVILLFLGLFAIAGLTSCQAVGLPSATSEDISTPEVFLTVGPPKTPSPTPICLPVVGVSLEVAPVASAVAEVTISGLVPYEFITIVFYSEGTGWTVRIETQMTVSDNGELEFVQDGLDKEAIAGIPSRDWKVQVIHARGVACAEIHLPSRP
jgi:hypothetical protein